MTTQEFEHIYTSVKSKLTSLAGRFAKAAALDCDAEDIVQEALLAFWELESNGYPVRNPEALLVKITKNICVSRYRRRKLPSAQPQEETLEGGESATKRTDRLDEALLKRRLYGSLSRTEREYMLLKTEEGLSAGQIAKIKGSSPGSIKTALSKARRKLKEKFSALQQ